MWRLVNDKDMFWVITSDGTVFKLKVKSEEVFDEMTGSSKANIKSPMPGTISKIFVEEG